MKEKPLTELSNEELWQLFPIIISGYKSCWKENYESEKTLLEQVIGTDNIRRIGHIGSTSVEGLPAKPTIDILIEIADDTCLEELTGHLVSAGYIYNKQPVNPPPHMMFMKGYTPRGFEGQAYHVHIRYAGDWDELYFRDYLSAHPETANEYAELKLALQQKYRNDRDAYTEAKTGFVKRITELAREAYPGRYANI